MYKIEIKELNKLKDLLLEIVFCDNCYQYNNLFTGKNNCYCLDDLKYDLNKELQNINIGNVSIDIDSLTEKAQIDIENDIWEYIQTNYHINELNIFDEELQIRNAVLSFDENIIYIPNNNITADITALTKYLKDIREILNNDDIEYINFIIEKLENEKYKLDQLTAHK